MLRLPLSLWERGLGGEVRGRDYTSLTTHGYDFVNMPSSSACDIRLARMARATPMRWSRAR